MMATRSTAERIRDVQGRLEGEANVWIATASADGVPHLVPLSLAWIGECVIVATPIDTLTARHALERGHARAALESTSDVVVVDGHVEIAALEDADEAVVNAFVDRVGWDPRDERGSWSLLTLTPRRIQAWNSPAEIAGRTIMRAGSWLDE